MKLNEFSKLYLDNHAIPSKISWKKDLSYINRFIVPTFGHREIKTIKRIEVVSWFNKVTVEHGPVSANRAQEVLRKMFNCALDWELFDKKNPATRIPRNKEQSRTEFVPPDVLPRLLIALTTSPHKSFKAAVLFLLLSGMRPGEVFNLRWSEVDLASRILTLAKTKNGKSHTLPLSAELLLILQELPRQGDWVFPSTRRQNRPFRNTHKPWCKIRDAADLPTLRLHDLRRTVGSYLAMANFSERIIGDVLNHQSSVSTRIYARLNLAPKQSALEHQEKQVNALALTVGIQGVHQLVTASPLGQTPQPLKYGT